MKWHLLSRAAGLKDEWLDSEMTKLTPEQRLAVDGRRAPLHRQLARAVFRPCLSRGGWADWRRPVPSERRAGEREMASTYHEVYARWRRDPEAFWGDAARAIDWIEPPRKVFDADAGIYGRWFPDASLNACYNCVDRHVEAGRGAQSAIIYDSPAVNFRKAITYDQLLLEVATLAQVLLDFGVAKGDRVVIYLPMIPRAHVAMLACARIGAIHSVVFGGFAAKELAARIDDATPKLILTASNAVEPGRIVPYQPLIEGAIAMARHKPATVMVWQRHAVEWTMVPGRDHNWEELVDAAEDEGPPRRLRADGGDRPALHPLHVGHDRRSKGVVRDTGGYLVALAWSMRAFYGVEPGEVFWCTSDVGWVSVIPTMSTGPLLIGATSICYEGKPVGTPDAGAFWRVCRTGTWSRLFTAPTAMRAIKKEDPDGAFLEMYDIPNLRSIFMAGERADAATVDWASGLSGLPVIDHWWADGDRLVHRRQSSGIGPSAGEAGLRHGADAGLHAGGDGRDRQAGPDRHHGRVRHQAADAARLPADPLGRDDRMRESYLQDYPGFYKTSDAGFVDADGHVFLLGRTDDHHQLRRAQAVEPAAWRRCWPRCRTSRNAPSSAWPIRSRARSPAASWC